MDRRQVRSQHTGQPPPPIGRSLGRRPRHPMAHDAGQSGLAHQDHCPQSTCLSFRLLALSTVVSRHGSCLERKWRQEWIVTLVTEGQLFETAAGKHSFCSALRNSRNSRRLCTSCTISSGTKTTVKPKATRVTNRGLFGCPAEIRKSAGCLVRQGSLGRWGMLLNRYCLRW
jgi:hypothetical protein